jgi:hypothetical protein
METPRATHKLNEARFFLRHLQEEEQKAVRNWPEAFSYYLSAFLSAAVSVIYVLEHEVEDVFNPTTSFESALGLSPLVVREIRPMMTLLNLGDQRQHVSHRLLAYG